MNYAIIEIFGHQRIVGAYSEVELAGAPMIKVDVPAPTPADVDGDEPGEGWSRYIAPSAIFSLSPCDESTVQRYVDYHRPRPIPDAVYLPREPKLLGAGVDDEDDIPEAEYEAAWDF